MKRFLLLLVLPVLVILAACGSDDGSTAAGANADRTVDIEMRDIAFSASSLDVRAGETVRFNFKNTGQVTHDAFIGDATAQDAHEREMREGHGDHGKGANAVTVKPGKSASLTHTFDRPGQVLIGCHEPGHYTGGMRITVNVA